MVHERHGSVASDIRPSIFIRGYAMIEKTQEFFSTLFTGLYGFVELRAIPLDKEDPNSTIMRGWWPCEGDNYALARTASAWSKNNDVYFGVNPRNGHAGDSGAVSHSKVLFADLDGMADVPDVGLPAPHVVVSSGGGTHCYWKLAQIVDLESDSLRKLYLDVQHRLVIALGADEHCRDIPRVLRVPGTINHKYPKPVELVCCMGVAPLTLGEWAHMLPPLPRRKCSYRDYCPDRQMPVWLAEQLSTPAPSGSWIKTATRLGVALRRKGFEEPTITQLLDAHRFISGKDDDQHQRDMMRLVRWVMSHIQPKEL